MNEPFLSHASVYHREVSFKFNGILRAYIKEKNLGLCGFSVSGQLDGPVGIVKNNMTNNFVLAPYKDLSLLEGPIQIRPTIDISDKVSEEFLDRLNLDLIYCVCKSMAGYKFATNDLITFDYLRDPEHLFYYTFHKNVRVHLYGIDFLEIKTPIGVNGNLFDYLDTHTEEVYLSEPALQGKLFTEEEIVERAV